MYTPVSPVIGNIYMGYFEELALGPECPIATPWWKRYVDIKCSPNSDDTLHTSVYRKTTHNDCYLDWNSNYQISAMKAVFHVLIYRAKKVSPQNSWQKKWTTSI